MKQKIIKQVNYWLGVTAIGLVLGFSLQFARAWTEPAVAPPGGNVGAPINTSLIAQIKQGNLEVNALGVSAVGNALLVPNGKVGIGTTNPGTSLDIYSSQPTPLYVRRSSGDNANMKFENTEGSIYMGLSQSEKFAIGTTNNLGASALMTVQTNGNVGIGTSNPGAKLTIGQDGQNWDDGLRLIRGGNHWDLLTGDSGKLWVGLNDSSKMVMDTSGRVGIGTVNPAKKLDVRGDIITDAGITLGGERRTTWPATAEVYFKEATYPMPRNSVSDDYWGGGLGCDGGDVLLGCYIKHRDGNNGCPQDNYLLNGPLFTGTAYLFPSENLDDHKCYLWRYGNFTCYGTDYRMVAKCMRAKYE